MREETKRKLGVLKDWFEGRTGSIVAFSGGIDSSLVLFGNGREKRVQLG